MRRSRRSLGGIGEVTLNVIPLIDVVFFLLVFYVLASTFLREETVAIERPVSAAATPAAEGFVTVAVTRDGTIDCAGVVALAALPGAVHRELAHAGGSRCVVVADGSIAVQTVLAVMDACRAGGASSVEIAANGATR